MADPDETVTCEDCKDVPLFLAREEPELTAAARHIAYGALNGGWCCDHVEYTDADVADAYRALWTRETRCRDRLRKGLTTIAQHAALDRSDRGIAEAQRYVIIADDTLRHAGLSPASRPDTPNSSHAQEDGDVPARDYREAFWYLYDRVCAIQYCAVHADLTPHARLQILADVAQDVLDVLEQWLEPIAEEDSYPTLGPCECGAERARRDIASR